MHEVPPKNQIRKCNTCKQLKKSKYASICFQFIIVAFEMNNFLFIQDHTSLLKYVNMVKQRIQCNDTKTVYKESRLWTFLQITITAGNNKKKTTFLLQVTEIFIWNWFTVLKYISAISVGSNNNYFLLFYFA